MESIRIDSSLGKLELSLLNRAKVGDRRGGKLMSAIPLPMTWTCISANAEWGSWEYEGSLLEEVVTVVKITKTEDSLVLEVVE